MTVLQRLAERAGGDGEGKDPDLTPAIGVVSDVGSALADGWAEELPVLQARIASVRERLEYDIGVEQSPVAGLRGPQSHVFLAGALWATNDLVGAYLDRLDEARGDVAGTSSRAAIRVTVLEHLRHHDVATPSEFIAAVEKRGGEARRDQVSRALHDLLAEGLVRSVEPRTGGDRRNRYYALSMPDTADSRWGEVLGTAKEAVRTVRELVGSRARTKAAFDEAITECFASPSPGAGGA
jgi:hypothetical protein